MEMMGLALIAIESENGEETEIGGRETDCGTESSCASYRPRT